MAGVYLYDFERPVKGDYLNIYKNQYGSLSNILLKGDLSVMAIAGDKYKISGKTYSDVITYSYDFDAQGYPIKEIVNKGGQGTYITEIFYK